MSRQPSPSGVPAVTTQEILRREHVKRLHKVAGVPKLYAGATLLEDGREPSHARAAAKLSSLLEHNATVILCGAETYRSGKTNLGCAVVNAFCDRGRSARYMVTLAFFTALKDTFARSPGEPNAAQVIETAAKPDLLVLDEFQVRSDSDWENNVFRHLIDLRHSEMRSTILIGNLAAADVPKVLGVAITKRIQEKGGFIECKWESKLKSPIQKSGRP